MHKWMASLFLLLLAVVNLFLTLYVHIQVKKHEVLVWDPARQTLQWARPQDHALERERMIALKDAVRIEFGWGRFRSQAELGPFKAAYWDALKVEAGCQKLYEQDCEILDVVWGGNYALIHFKSVAEILQVNFRNMRRGSISHENPTGWRFDGWLCLVEAGGLSL